MMATWRNRNKPDKTGLFSTQVSSEHPLAAYTNKKNSAPRTQNLITPIMPHTHLRKHQKKIKELLWFAHYLSRFKLAPIVQASYYSLLYTRFYSLTIHSRCKYTHAPSIHFFISLAPLKCYHRYVFTPLWTPLKIFLIAPPLYNSMNRSKNI